MQTENKKRKRPKKGNRFMRNAKGFAKQGIYGRGTTIEDGQFSYFINILDAMKTDMEDVDERVNMANNVFDQTQDQEIHLASNQVVSKALESLIGFVDNAHLERYFQKFGENLRPICSDRFASHVLQKMIEIAFLRGVGKNATSPDTEDASAPSAPKRAKPDAAQTVEEYNLKTTFNDEHSENCRSFVLRISKFVLNNLEDFVWDPCANHIMRTSILCLVGMHVPKIAFEKGGTELAKHRTMYTVPDEWVEVMKEFPQRLEMWPQFDDFPYQEHSSALLGIICLALSVVDKSMLKHFGKKILMKAFLKPADDSEDKPDDEKKTIEIPDEGEGNEQSNEKVPPDSNTEVQLPQVFHYQSSIVLLETLLSVAGAKLLTQLYAMLFSGRVAHLAQQQQTNFAVQRLLQYIKEVADFESIFTELQSHIESLLQVGYTGVVSSLTAACLRLATKQAQMIGALQSALHVAGDKEKSKRLFNCLIKLKPYDVLTKDTTNFVHLHGSLIVQHLLQFNKPIFLVNCILELPPEELSQIFNTPNGSHVVDAFMQSKFIGEKSREKLIRLLDGFYIDLAITRHGSRVLEQCFAAAQESQKLRIAKELFDKSNKLKGSPYGRLIYTKYRLETYKLSPSQWQASLSQQQQQHKQKDNAPKKTTSELFKDILS